MKSEADHHSQLLRKARGLHQEGKLDDAATLYRRVLKGDPAHFDAIHLLGVLRFQQGRDAEAADLIGAALEKWPDAPHALSNYALCLQRLGRVPEAIESYSKALKIEPSYPEAHNNKGSLLASLERYEEALDCYQRALAARPNYTEALCNRGDAERLLGRHEDALQSYGAALKLDRSYLEAWLGRGDVLCRLGRHRDGIADYDQALSLSPRDPDALNNRAVALAHLDFDDRALRDLEQAISTRPRFAEAWNNRGNVQRKLGRHADALVSYDQALSINPDYAEALNNRGNAMCSLGRFNDALASYDKALTKRPDYVDLLVNRGKTLAELNRFAEAVTSYERVLAIEPENPAAFEGLARSALRCCDWSRVEKIAAQLLDRVAGKRQVFDPLLLMRYTDDPALLSRCAKDYVAAQAFPPATTTTVKRDHGRIRLGYLSSDFNNHAVAILIAELFEIHDRSRFEIYGISFGRDDGSPMRARLVKAFDRFYDVRDKSDAEVCRLLNELEIDIAVDLNGHTKGARTGVLARRPAPIQVNYLGYPGTMGADFMDYVIVDMFVAPPDQQQLYAEKLVHLPDCYQVNDSKRQVAARVPTRREVGLPDSGFVFCCFNQAHKITSTTLDIWMRLLKNVAGSVLWLLRSDDTVEVNLRREVAARGVDPARVLFAGIVSPGDHLARQQLGDLFLDTLPYNAHTTASDALWVGLPVLTCSGRGFAARVAGSILHAAGLPELVTNSYRDYESLALELATDPSRLRAIREKLELDRLSSPLFDTPRFCRHIEAAYTTMWERWQRGEPPLPFAIAPHAARSDRLIDAAER